MTVWIGQVKEPLAPMGVLRRCIGSIAGSNYTPMEAIDVRVVKNHPSPPCPLPMAGLGSQIQKIRTRPQTCELCVLTAIDRLKTQNPIELDGAPHIMGGECHRAQTLYH